MNRRNKSILNYISALLKKLPFLTTFAFIAILAACSNTVFHAFEFGRMDSPNTWVLAYKYGNSQIPLNEGIECKNGPDGYAGVSINGNMLVGDFLFVKWQDRKTDLIWSDNVDLKQLLPKDMLHQLLYFVVSGERLTVYLIDENKFLPAGQSSVAPRQYHVNPAKIIYNGRGNPVKQ